MDPLVGFLDGPRARGAFLICSIMSPPWSIRIQDQAPLTIAAMVRGQAWVGFDRAVPVRLQPGDVAIFRGPDPYTVADDPETPPQVVIHPGQRCATPDGTSTELSMDLGLRTWGNDAAGADMLVTGTYQAEGEIGGRLVDALPPLVVLRRDDWDGRLVDLLAGEIVRDAPGQEVMLDRLLDLLVVTALRAWFSRPDAATPAW